MYFDGIAKGSNEFHVFVYDTIKYYLILSYLYINEYRK